MQNTTATPTPPPADDFDWSGQVLGEFRIQHRLGKGGMGQVYLAEQTSLKRKVALKLLNPELAGNERSLLRFKTEAENVARATHANIVQIYTIGSTGGVHYIALEYVEGRNLREFIEKKGPPELSLGLHVMAQVAAALQRAGELGVIHRDIKPENILLTKKGEVKVADFGLSRLHEDAGGEQLSLTQSQVTMGTPLYMSPEQVERRTVDSRTDIYSFGVTCYHMFAGQPPFRGNSPIDVAYQHVHGTPQALSEIRPDLPAELCAIIAKMMAKEPQDRYQSAGEIVREINRLREALNLGTVAAVSISSSFLGNGPDPRALSGHAVAGNAPGGRWFLRVLGICGVLAALAGGLAVGWGVNHRDGPGKDSTIVLPDDGLAKKPLPAKTDENEMRQLVLKYEQPTTPGQLAAGLEHAVELGLFYIKERRPDEAEKFFAGLASKDQKVAAYRFLGKLGHPIALAFKDEAAASNEEFLTIIAKIEKFDGQTVFKKKTDLPPFTEFEGYKLVWKQNQPMREMVAKALNRNYANDPKNFPADKLEPYRYPPRPTLKAAATP